MKLSIFGALLCVMFAGAVFAEDTITDATTNETFPREVSFDFNGKPYFLETTGVTTRKKFIIKVYSIASYLQKGVTGDKLQAILSDDNAKQLTMKWVRDVSASQVRVAFEEAFHKVFGVQYDAMQGTIDRFLSFFKQGAQKDDVYVLRWIPGGNVDVLVNNKNVGSLSNAAFAKGLWTVWFGDHSIVDKNELLK